jgi:hypothetical protein
MLKTAEIRFQYDCLLCVLVVHGLNQYDDLRLLKKSAHWRSTQGVKAQFEQTDRGPTVIILVNYLLSVLPGGVHS